MLRGISFSELWLDGLYFLIQLIYNLPTRSIDSWPLRDPLPTCPVALGRRTLGGISDGSAVVREAAGKYIKMSCSDKFS